MPCTSFQVVLTVCSSLGNLQDASALPAAAPRALRLGVLLRAGVDAPSHDTLAQHFLQEPAGHRAAPPSPTPANLVAFPPEQTWSSETLLPGDNHTLGRTHLWGISQRGGGLKGPSKTNKSNSCELGPNAVGGQHATQGCAAQKAHCSGQRRPGGQAGLQSCLSPGPASTVSATWSGTNHTRGAPTPGASVAVEALMF